MKKMSSGQRYVMIMVVWTIAAIMGLTVALAAVGWLGLWVAVGAIAGLGTTVVGGIFLQFAFATDFDAILEARRNSATGRDTSS
jgi:fatty acid desaturase